MAVELALTNRGAVLLDEEDYERFARLPWRQTPAGYAARNARSGEGASGSWIWLHREIIAAPSSAEVDHINGHRLDDRRENLRLATSQQNHWNQIGRPDRRRSRFKGVVAFIPRPGLWRAQIKLDGRIRYLGYFRNEEAAARAYDVAACALFGEFARPNFPAEPRRLGG